MNSSPLSPRDAVTYGVRATIRTFKAFSGPFLSTMFAVALVVLVYADGWAGAVTETSPHQASTALELAGWWLMVSGTLALSSLPRINKSFHGASGMLWWHRWATLLGYLLVGVALAVAVSHEGWATGSTIAMAVVVTLAGVVMVVYWFGPNRQPRIMRTHTRHNPLRIFAKVSFDVIYPLFTWTMVLLWVVTAVHLWQTAPITPHLVYRFSGYLIVLIILVVTVLHVLIWQQIRTDRRYPGIVVRVVHPTPDKAIVSVELEEIVVRGRPKSYWYTAGQYSYLGVPRSGVGLHPFTMTSIPNVVGRSGPTVNVGVDSRMRTQGIAWDRTVEYCIKASGNGSQWLVDNLVEGQQVSVSTPRGGTHPARGGQQQLWVAGGVGITPFVAWLRDIEANIGPHFPGTVTLVWSYRGSDKPAYLDFIRRCHAEWEWFTLVEVNTEQGARLSPHSAHALAFPSPTLEKGQDGRAQLYGADVSVVICGPTDLCQDYNLYFLEQGVPPHRLYVDAFHIR